MAISLRIHAGFCFAGVWAAQSSFFHPDALGVFEVLENANAVADVFILVGGAAVYRIFSLHNSRASAAELDCAGDSAVVRFGGGLLGGKMG